MSLAVHDGNVPMTVNINALRRVHSDDKPRTTDKFNKKEAEAWPEALEKKSEH